MPQLALAILLELFATLTITCFSLQMQHTKFHVAVSQNMQPGLQACVHVCVRIL